MQGGKPANYLLRFTVGSSLQISGCLGQSGGAIKVGYVEENSIS